jgi:hypothetical protein
MTRHKSFVIVGAIVTLLAGVINGQSPVEIRAAASSAVAGWKQMASVVLGYPARRGALAAQWRTSRRHCPDG